MKIAPILAIASIVLLLGAGCSKAPRVAETASTTSTPIKKADTKQSLTMPNPQGMPSYTLEEVSTHAKSTDCWLVIREKVYDVTSYIPKHPGGEAIIQGCGKEATALFDGIAKHDGKAEALLPQFELGLLAK